MVPQSFQEQSIVATEKLVWGTAQQVWKIFASPLPAVCDLDFKNHILLLNYLIELTQILYYVRSVGIKKE